MARLIVTDQDIGHGLKIENKKVVVDIAALNIPVDVKLAGVDIDKTGKKMTFTLSDDTVIEKDIADFLAVDTDTKIVSGRYDVPGTSLILTDSNGGEIPVDFVGLTDTINAEIDAKIAPVAERVKALEDTEAAKRTEKLVSLGGVYIGEVEIEDEE